MRQFCLFIGALGYALAAQSPVIHSLDASIASVNAMTQDSAGNLYLTGATTSLQFPVTPGTYQTHYHDEGLCDYVGDVVVPCSEAFVMKLDATGKVLWATLLGGSGWDGIGAIAVDSTGNVILTGETSPVSVGGQANDFPVTADALFPNPTAQNSHAISVPVDSFLSILSPDGKKLIYSTYLPGLQGLSLALGPEDGIYLSGSVERGKSSIRPTPGSFQTAFRATATTVLVMKLKARGTALAYATYLGGSHWEESGAIAVDSSGSVYVTGVTDSADFPVTAGSFRTARTV